MSMRMTPGVNGGQLPLTIKHVFIRPTRFVFEMLWAYTARQ